MKNLRVPMFCPVCERIMKGSKSTNTYYDFGCCSDCFIEFVDGRVKKWKSGWRPDEKELEIYYKKLGIGFFSD